MLHKGQGVQAAHPLLGPGAESVPSRVSLQGCHCWQLCQQWSQGCWQNCTEPGGREGIGCWEAAAARVLPAPQA